jgi:hypothetical protein
MKNAIRPRCALLEDGIQKQKPAASRVHAIFGKVNRRRFRRPKVSIVQNAGQAKLGNGDDQGQGRKYGRGRQETHTKFMRPKPQEARSEFRLFAPASEKMVDE